MTEHVQVKGPGGTEATLRGQNAIILLILAAALGGMLWLQRADRTRNLEVFDAAVRAGRLEHAELLAACKGAR